MKKLLGLLIALSITVPAFASIAISPTKIEINANKLRSNYAVATVEVRGESQNPVRFRIFPEYFTITENSEMNFMKPNNNPHDLSKNVRFVPSEFTVPPGKTQKVRVNIANVNMLPDGESRTVLFFEDVNTKEMNVPNNYGIGAQLIMKTRIGVPVYVDKGKFVKKGDIEYFKIVRGDDGLYTEMKILSTGNSRIRYSGKIQIMDGKKLLGEYNISEHVVGDNNFYVARQKIKTDCIKGAGEYKIRAVVSYLDENSNRKFIKKDTVLRITGEKI